jgi:hypothetical protein
MKSGSARLAMTRRGLLGGGVALTSCALLAGVGDRLLANRSLADFISGVPGRMGWRNRINQGLAECAAAGMAVTGSAGDFPLDGPLHIPSRLRITCEPGCVIRKAYDDPGDRNALLQTRGELGGQADGFEWVGGEFRPMDETLGKGHLATLLGHGWTFRNAVMRDWRDGLCFIFGGGGFQLHDVNARSMQHKVGTGTFRCIWNDPAQPSRCFNLVGVGGDDVFQAVPISNPRSEHFGLDIGNLTFENCEGTSHVARLIAALVVMGQPGNDVLLPSRITNCTWRNVRGRGGRRSVIVENSYGDVAKGSLVDNILIENCAIDCSGEDGTLSDSVRLWSDRQAVGTVRITGSSIAGSRRPRVMTVEGVRKLVIDGGSSVSGTGQAVRAGGVYPVGDVELRDAHFSRGSGAHAPLWMKLDGQLSTERITVDGRPSSREAVRLSHGR